MLNALKRLFERFETNVESGELGHDELNLCTFALMSIVAGIDQDFSEQERNQIIEIGIAQLDIERAEAEALLADARIKSDQATSLHNFTSKIHNHFSDEDKYQLMINLWRVAYADKYIDKFEEHIIRRIADLLYVDHVRFIESKLSVIGH